MKVRFSEHIVYRSTGLEDHRKADSRYVKRVYRSLRDVGYPPMEARAAVMRLLIAGQYASREDNRE